MTDEFPLVDIPSNLNLSIMALKVANGILYVCLPLNYLLSPWHDAVCSPRMVSKPLVYTIKVNNVVVLLAICRVLKTVHPLNDVCIRSLAELGFIRYPSAWTVPHGYALYVWHSTQLPLRSWRGCLSVIVPKRVQPSRRPPRNSCFNELQKAIYEWNTLFARRSPPLSLQWQTCRSLGALFYFW